MALNEKGFVKLEQKLVRNIKSFHSYNNLRIQRLLDLMPNSQKPLFHILPFLLHTNIPGLPGYLQDNDTPFGFSRFKIDESMEKAIKDLFPEIQPQHVKNNKRAYLRSLILMGSLGSVAQNSKSDFDYWLCYRENELTVKQLQLLSQKIRNIETWADEHAGLEVHFFLTDIKKTQNNDFGKAGGESAGSSQPRLLKEEFYRTMIVVSGMTPFWWITPPGTNDQEYKHLKQVAKASNKITTESFIDLGNLTEITTKEFFGAAIWQILKAIDSPFKSAMKLAMLEIFISPSSKKDLLCDVLKDRVHSAPVIQKSGKFFDPYTILLDAILDHYQNKTETLDLLRTCIYIKSAYHPNQKMADGENFKQEIMFSYIKTWNWPLERQLELSHYEKWTFDKVKHLGERLHQFLMSTYQNLSTRLKILDFEDQIISREDTTIIGRKLASYYQRKNGKINIVKRAFEEGLRLESATFSALKPTYTIWYLHRDPIKSNQLSPKDAANRQIKSGSNLVGMIAWAVINKIIDQKTTLNLAPNPLPPNINDIHMVTKNLLNFFPLEKLSSLSNKSILNEERKKKVYLVGNFCVAKWEKKIVSLSVIHLTTWGEYFHSSIQKIRNQQEIDEFLIMNFLDQEGKLPTEFKIFVPTGQWQKKIQQEIESQIENCRTIRKSVA